MSYIHTYRQCWWAISGTCPSLLSRSGDSPSDRRGCRQYCASLHRCCCLCGERPVGVVHSEDSSTGTEPLGAVFPGPEPLGAVFPGPKPLGAVFPGPEPLGAVFPGPKPLGAVFPGPEPLEAIFPGPEMSALEREGAGGIR